MKISKKQKHLLEWLEAFIAEHDYSPSYREIASGMGYRSISTVASHIDNLVVLGYVRKVENSARSLELVASPQVESRKLKAESYTELAQQLRSAMENVESEEDKEVLKKAAEILLRIDDQNS